MKEVLHLLFNKKKKKLSSLIFNREDKESKDCLLQMGAEGVNRSQTIGKTRVSTGKNTGQIRLSLSDDLSEEFLPYSA